jgi:hypothetical protein
MTNPSSSTLIRDADLYEAARQRAFVEAWAFMLQDRNMPGAREQLDTALEEYAVLLAKVMPRWPTVSEAVRDELVILAEVHNLRQVAIDTVNPLPPEPEPTHETNEDGTVGAV